MDGRRETRNDAKKGTMRALHQSRATLFRTNHARTAPVSRNFVLNHARTAPVSSNIVPSRGQEAVLYESRPHSSLYSKDLLLALGRLRVLEPTCVFAGACNVLLFRQSDYTYYATTLFVFLTPDPDLFDSAQDNGWPARNAK